MPPGQSAPGSAIVLRNIGILNQTRRNIDLINLGPFGQAAHQIITYSVGPGINIST